MLGNCIFYDFVAFFFSLPAAFPSGWRGGEELGSRPHCELHWTRWGNRPAPGRENCWLFCFCLLWQFSPGFLLSSPKSGFHIPILIHLKVSSWSWLLWHTFCMKILQYFYLLPFFLLYLVNIWHGCLQFILISLASLSEHHQKCSFCFPHRKL